MSEGWGSEAFSRDVEKQLDRIARWIVDPQPDEGAVIAVHAEFSARVHAPETLSAIFETGSFRVRRPSSATRAPSNESDEDSAGRFISALRAMVDPLAGTNDRHVKFKVVAVKSGADGTVDTRVLFEGSGVSAEGAVQINATLACGWTPSGAGGPSLRSLDIVDYEEVEFLGGRPAPMFSDCTDSVVGSDRAFADQLRYGNEHWMRRLQPVLGIDNYGQHGLAVGDVNGDGFEDVYVCQAGGMPNRLYIQRPDGTVREAAAAAGVDFMDRTHAALLIDLDNDGDQDLVLATEPAVLFLTNDGKGAFAIAGRGAVPSAYSLAAADYDNDGDLDVYATAYVAPAEWDREAGLGLQPLPYHDANNGAPNALFRNDGKGSFVDATAEIGLDVNNRRWSFAAAWADYDADGDADLYVANDFGRNNLYRNDGGRFTDVAAEAGVEDSASGMSVSWGDYDGDGRFDLYVGNMFSSAGNRIVPQRRFQPGAGESARSGFRRFARGNTLFRNNGDGTFDDVSVAAGASMGRWAWSSPFVDLNNDGWEDLVVGNGYITNENSGDL